MYQDTEAAAPIDWKIRIFRGQADISFPRPGSVQIRYSGACVTQHATAVIRLLDQWIEEGRAVDVHLDLFDLECHAAAFGQQWRRWLTANRERLSSFEVLSIGQFEALRPLPMAA
ncbi:MAG: hypothetical protein KC431_02010 [Myxococcales bacterium]|nr:hypothetical protein [Myxococcales bacterium]MCA9696270.1 hypothetical protein [Myxococcales bacterium]